MAPAPPRPLPPGWRWAKLGEVAEYTNGRAFKPEDWGTTGVPIVRIQNLTSAEGSFNYYGGPVDSAHALSDGDLLVSWSASLDVYFWTRGPAVLNQHIFKVVERPGVARRDYLFYAFKMIMASIRSQVHGATMRHITKPEFEATPLPLPPLPEQRRIAGILNEQMQEVEKARKATEAQLAAASALPAAYLREVFDSEKAKKWPRKKLEEVATLLPAGSLAEDGDTAVLAATTACLTEGGFNPAGTKRAKMASSDAAACVLREGEVLVARSNTPELVGRATVYEGNPPGVVASDLTIRVQPSSSMLPRFLGAFLSWLYTTGYWRNVAGGASGTMKKIRRSQLVALAIPVPLLSEQRRTAGILNEQVAEVLKHRKMLEDQQETINRLPAALLRKAFAGEV